jgi:hypothetical protein
MTHPGQSNVISREPYMEIRGEETARENAQRVAIDALYRARDEGRNMHDAGREAADAALAVICAEFPTVRPEALDQ